MRTEQEREAYELFEQLVDLSPDERERALAERCQGRADLEDRVRELLQALEGERSGEPALPSFVRASSSGDASTSGIEHPPGTMLGVYRLGEPIGVPGGMGTVYRAERADGSFRQTVAVKVMRRGLDSEAFIRRFRAERQILSRLEHPNIVRLLDGGSTPDGRPFIAMELVEHAVPITEYCDGHQLDVRARLDLFIKVCRAAQYAHENLIVHRDLKPSNVVVAEGGEPKLLDFGIAKLLDPDLADDLSMAMTAVDERLLTPEYASPEQVKGEPVVPATDVYALGVMLFELLTGERPYKLPSRGGTELARIICEQQPQRPSTVVANAAAQDGGEADSSSAARQQTRPESRSRLARRLQGDLDTIVLKALQKEPARRYASGEQFAVDLERHVAGLPVLARPDTLGYRLGKFTQRHPVGVAASVLALVAAIAGVTAIVWQARAAELARQQAEAQRGRAEQRSEDVRRVATDLVFRLHDSIKDLAGATAARSLVLERGVEYLDRLARDAAGDVRLQLELADAYERIGELQNSPFGATVVDTKVGLEQHRRAQAIRDALVTTDPVLKAAVRTASVRGLSKLGDGLFGVGNVAEGVDTYRRAIGLAEQALAEAPADDDMQRLLATTASRLCSTLLTRGDVKGALDQCGRSIKAFGGLLQRHRDDRSLRQSAAMAHSAMGNALRVTGQLAPARERLAFAAGELGALLDSEPTNATLQGNLATTSAYLGAVSIALADETAALRAYRDAVDLSRKLLEVDPQNQRWRSILTFAALRGAPILMKTSGPQAAAEWTGRALQVLREQADRPNASRTDRNEYASWLMTCEPVSLRNPQEALRYAQRAAEGSDEPVYLDTLALAYFQTGDSASAIATGERALAQLPAASGPSTGLRKEIEGHLEMFRGRAR